MIPTLLLVGAVLAKWWWQTVLAAAVLFPALLWATGTIDRPGQVAVAAGLAAANVACAAAITRGLIRIWRDARS